MKLREEENRKPQLVGETSRIVIITSGKGGVRKTTTAANIGLSLARLNLSVVAIDTDTGLCNRVNYTAVEVLNGDCHLDQALFRDKRWPSLELLCISKPRSKIPLSFGSKAIIWLVESL
ncbi:hypothetical protein KSP39_PZI021787 [Platanthera zijinensis]|uniref:CobQ/CobB/MinD/ParA nucleotide binding domain-containing protein n=1 Tax=Platanthera zijinensis TaxID=2320716 RepID=A0AAP0AYB6_9ASPA